MTTIGSSSSPSNFRLTVKDEPFAVGNRSPLLMVGLAVALLTGSEAPPLLSSVLLMSFLLLLILLLLLLGGDLASQSLPLLLAL